MNPAEVDSIAKIALAAAFADGALSDDETARVRSLLSVPEADAAIERARTGTIDLAGAASILATPELKSRAYELAVCVIEADGHRTPAEAGFLQSLAGTLGVEPAAAQAVLDQVDAIAAPLAIQPAPEADGPPPLPGAPSGPDPGTEELIRNTAILAGALELLPQSVASFAILPVQANLVYRIGKARGIPLNAESAKEFLAAAGIGFTSQMLEGVARRFLGGFMRSLAGGVAGGITKTATGPVMSFATTYAIGRLADQYYAGGRNLSALQLKETFQSLVRDATAMGEKLGPDMQQRAQSLDLTKLPQLLSGKA